MACHEVSNLAGSREELEGFELQDRVSCQCGRRCAQYNAMSAADWQRKTRTPALESVDGPIDSYQRVTEVAGRLVRPREQVLFAGPICAP